MSYTDEQMVIASQIAYMDFLNGDYLKAGSYTIMEMLEKETRTGDSEHRRKARELIEKIENGKTTQVCADWKLKDVCNKQHQSGMYACMIETGDRDALVAFRGSESDSMENVAKDWVISDMGLLNSVLTPQQATAETYIKYLNNKYGGQYDSFGMTGHSLGGNLAEHAKITAPDDMRNKIRQCVNLDGPGFSENYMIEHAAEIEKAKHCIQHYQWSWVGALLNPAPGTDYKTVAAKTPLDKILPPLILLWRHDTVNLKYDENGNVMRGFMDPLAKNMGPLSKVLDFSIFTAALMFSQVKEFGNFLAEAAEDSVNAIQNGIGILWEKWQQIRGGGGTACFEICPQRLAIQTEELEALSTRIGQISAEVEQIRREMEFDSLAAGYIKLKLWNISNKIENDSDKMKKFCGKGKECGQYYREAEEQIANNYC